MIAPEALGVGSNPTGLTIFLVPLHNVSALPSEGNGRGSIPCGTATLAPWYIERTLLFESNEIRLTRIGATISGRELHAAGAAIGRGSSRQQGSRREGLPSRDSSCPLPPQGSCNPNRARAVPPHDARVGAQTNVRIEQKRGYAHRKTFWLRNSTG